MPNKARRSKLLQVLGVSFGIAVLVGNTILIGILRTPGDVAARLPSPALFIGVWVVGGIYALLGAASLAEPGAMVAESGGQYPIVRRGLGEYPAFVVGWSDWLSTCGPIALGAMVVTEYLEPLVPALTGRRVPAGVGLVLLFGLLLWRGIRVGDLTQQLLSALKALAFGALIGVCLLVPVPAGTGVGPAALPSGVALVTAVVLALQAVIYTYDGWTGPLYFGEETRDPGRGIPRSMVLGVLLVILIYVLVNVAFVRVLGIGRMAGDPFVAATAGKAIFGPRGDLVIRLLVLISIMSGMNACALMAPRVMLAMSRDRLLPGAFETVNRRRHSDGGALDQHRGRRRVHRLGHGQYGARPVRVLLRRELHAVVSERVRASAEGARYAEAVAGARVSVHHGPRGAGVRGVPCRIGGERLGEQLEVDAAAGAQLPGVSGRRREARSGGAS